MALSAREMERFAGEEYIFLLRGRINTSSAPLMLAWRTIGPRSPVNSNLSVPCG